MTASWLSMAIELLVAGLLTTTIAWCVILDRRLRRLRGDETVFRQTIGEIVIATENAERAIAGLKAAVKECDGDFGDRIRLAERLNVEMERQLRAGREMIERISLIIDASRSAGRATLAAAANEAATAASAGRGDAARTDRFAGTGAAALRTTTDRGKTGSTLQAAQALVERSRQRTAG